MTITGARSQLERINDFWWVHLPARAHRRSRMIAGILMDGLYLSAGPWISALMPVILIVLGLFLGWLHPGFGREKVFSASLMTMTVLMIIGSLSAAWGGWLWLGYVVGDFFLYQHKIYYYYYQGFFDQLLEVLRVRLPLCIPYVLLALLLMFIPLIARSLRTQTLAWLKQTSTATIIVQALLQAVLQGPLIFMWVQAVPTLIRPVYTWQGGSPTAEVVQPLQRFGWVLVVLAAISGAARVILELWLMQRPAVGQRAASLYTVLLSSVRLRERQLPEWVSVLLKAAFSTFMLAGILETWLDALLFATVMGLMLLGREYLSSHLEAWTKLINHVPLLLRLVVGIGLNFLLARQIITAMWYSSGTFRPIIISVALSLLIFFLLIPDLKTQVYRNRAETR